MACMLWPASESSLVPNVFVHFVNCHEYEYRVASKNVCMLHGISTASPALLRV